MRTLLAFLAGLTIAWYVDHMWAYALGLILSRGD